MSSDHDRAYRDLIHSGRRIYAGHRIGHPGKGWLYWTLFPIAQVLRLHWRITVHGSEQVAPGAAILFGNHLKAIDPIMVGMSNRWRLVFFTKAEVWDTPGAFFFWMLGQIPIRRGDEESTKWALAMSSHVLRFGDKLCVYAEGARSPDGVTMHRLHRRVLVPVLQANPGVPVHVMSIAYRGRRRGRQQVELRVSPALALDSGRMSANELTEAVTQALLDLGDMPYTHSFAR